MKILRHALGFFLACVAGVVVPVAGSIFDSLYRRSHGAHDPDWSLSYNAQFVAIGSGFVGAIAGGIGVFILHRLHRSKLRDYAIGGAINGAATGTLFAVMFNMRSDPLASWLIFIILPATSMMLGFISYWFVSIRKFE